MTALRSMAIAALLGSALATPALAQDVPVRAQQMNHARMDRHPQAYWNSAYDRDAYGYGYGYGDAYGYRQSGFWPADVAAGVVGGAIGTAGAIATAPFRNDWYASNAYYDGDEWYPSNTYYPSSTYYEANTWYPSNTYYPSNGYYEENNWSAPRAYYRGHDRFAANAYYRDENSGPRMSRASSGRISVEHRLSSRHHDLHREQMAR